MALRKSWLPFVIVLLLAAVLFLLRRCQEGNEPAPKRTETSKKKANPTDVVNRNRGFDRRTSFLEYTEHAKWRMKCRKITQAEVEEIMKEGKINYKKSDVNDRPCPTYALEGMTSDDQRVRIVFAQCDYKSKVVTVIDLETDWQCDCPGDDRKHQNQR